MGTLRRGNGRARIAPTISRLRHKPVSAPTCNSPPTSLESSPARAMRILQTVAGLWSGTGGPVASITSLCRGLAALGHQVTLLTGSGPLHPDVAALVPQVRLRTVPLGPYLLGNWSPAFRRACLEEARHAEVVHDHGVWLDTNAASVRMARRAHAVVVRSPRGMLSPWARRRSHLAKSLLWRLRERALFDDSDVVHVTSHLEQAELEPLGIRARTVVIPNGVDLLGEYSAEAVASERHHGISGIHDRRVVLFMSRLHAKKGLDILCKAWERLDPAMLALLMVAGPGDPEQIASLRRWVDRQCGPPAHYLGPVSGQEKIRLLTSARLLALPSYSENYGMVVAEALACGTPVLTTTEMPWTEVEARGCGWVIRPSVEALLPTLRAALDVDDQDHERMRARARAFIEESHSLDRCVKRMADLYAEAAASRRQAS